MSIKRAGGKPANGVKAKQKNFREEFFMTPGKRNTPRLYDGKPMDLADGTTSHNGVVVGTVNLAKR